MLKELYIYSPLYSYTAETVVKELNEVSENEDLTIRMNTPGGEVTAGWAIISKMSERKSPINAIIDGDAASMGALMLVFFDHVTANDTSLILFHKAGYPNWYDPSQAELERAKKINAQFKEKLSAKVNGKPGAQKFLDKLFEADVRNDVELTPSEAKKLGIIDEVRKLEPKAYSGMQMVAMIEEGQEIKKIESKQTPESGDNNNPKSNHMTLEKLKAEHPALYAQIFESGNKAGIEAGKKIEKERVQAWAVYNSIDPVAVEAGIESGENLGQKAMAEFNFKALSGKKIAKIEGENIPAVDPPKEVLTEEQLEAKKDQDLLDKELGKTKEY